jgi:peptidoglycan/xylan/chitin deacetylase (PgdA/CDA1 family)
MNNPDKLACLTVDLEHDFGDLNPSPTFEGLALVPRLVAFARDSETPLSWFVQGLLFDEHPRSVEQVVEASPADVYLHGYSHNDPRSVEHIAEIRRGMEAFESFLGRRPAGYRAPLGVISSEELYFLAQNRFCFDSSIFPTWRPGRFCHLAAPNRPHLLNGRGMLEIPISVVGPLMPVPLSVSYLKLLGRPFRHALRSVPLPRVVVVGMHMHDLEPLASADCLAASNENPLVLDRCYGARAARGWRVLEELLSTLRGRGYRFTGMGELASMYRSPHR